MAVSPLVKAYSAAELVARGAPKLFTTSAAVWKAKMVDWFETSEDGPKRKLYPAQYEMVLIDLLSYCFSLLGKEGQAASEQRWLLFSKGEHLDVVAANNSTYRLKASAALCKLEITLDAVRDEAFYLPTGTVVVADDFAFSTDEQIVIPAGSLTAEVSATATDTGPDANGLLPGQINALQAPQNGVSVTNLSETEGGADEEDDDALRFRAAYAHDRISKAGPKESYRQQVRAYSSAIIDVEVVRPEPGHIWIYPLLEDGVPGESLRAEILKFMTPETKRPQGDDLAVQSPEAVTFTVTGTARATGDLNKIKATLEAAIADAAQIWSRELGNYLALSALTVVARSYSNVVDVDLSIAGLADKQLQPHQFAVLTSVSLTMEAADG